VREVRSYVERLAAKINALHERKQVIVYDTSGQTHTYTSTGSGFTPPAGEDSTLVRNADGSLTLLGSDSTTYQFDATGHLTSAQSGTDDRSPAARD
jgi:large repetitive protein